MKVLGAMGIVFCLCGFATAGIGYAFGGVDYMRAENLADIRGVFSLSAGHGSQKASKNGTGSGNIKVDTGNIKAGNTKTDGADSMQAESGDAGGVKTWQSDGIRLDSVSGIKADLACIDLEIAVSDDNSFHMSYELHCMNRKNPLSYTIENGILNLAETDFKEPSWKGWFWNTGSIINKYYSCITLYVPSDTVLKSCSLNIADSDLTIRELHCNTMEIEAADGDINIRDGACSETVLKTEDGDIIFSNTEISGDLQLDTVDGDIRASGLDVKGAVQLDTADGDVSFTGLKVSGGMKINAEDGDIKMSDFAESGGLFLQTEYGDISGSSINITGKMQINTEDGDVTLSNLGVSGKVDVVSECGDISVRIQKKSLPELKIIMDTEDGDLSVSRSLGGKKRNGHYERNGSAGACLTGDTEEGDILLK